MTTKLKWRLGKLPSPEEVTLLLSQSVLTKDEAREILFSLETDEDRDKQSLQEEIKFLRELVERLSKNKPERIVETIRYIEKPYITQGWYHPYYIYSNSTTGGGTMYYTNGANMTNAIGSISSLTSATSNSNMLTSSTQQTLASGNQTALTPTIKEFTSIKTF